MARRQLGARAALSTDAVIVQDLIDSGFMTYFGTWTGAIGYSPGNVVKYNQRSYVCTSTVAAPAATSLIGTGSLYNATATSTTQTLPTGCQAGDVMMIAFAVATGSVTRTAPISGAALVSPALNYGNNTVFGWVWAYFLTSGDISANSVTFVNQSPNSSYGAVYHVFRNTANNFFGNSGTSGLASTSFTPTAYPDYIYNITFANLTAGNSSVVTQSAQTSLQQLSQTGVLVIGAGYEQIASGATTSRTWTRTNSNGTGGTLAAALGSSAGSPNTTPDLDTSHWVALEGAPTPNWIALTLNTGWANVGAPYTVARYCVLPSGTVVVQGMVVKTGAVIGATDQITGTGALAAGARPSGSLVFPGVESGTNNYGLRYVVSSAGTITLANTTVNNVSGSNLSLAGIIYPAEQ